MRRSEELYVRCFGDTVTEQIELVWTFSEKKMMSLELPGRRARRRAKRRYMHV